LRRTHVDLDTFIRDIPDFPKEGIVFKDITPLLGDRDAVRSRTTSPPQA
jgi:adenine phosphoribosyltransferase